MTHPSLTFSVTHKYSSGRTRESACGHFRIESGYYKKRGSAPYWRHAIIKDGILVGDTWNLGDAETFAERCVGPWRVVDLRDGSTVTSTRATHCVRELNEREVGTRFVLLSPMRVEPESKRYQPGAKVYAWLRVVIGRDTDRTPMVKSGRTLARNRGLCDDGGWPTTAAIPLMVAAYRA